jgi:hypothetical protein
MIQPVKSVNLKKDEHTWTAEFVATPELLKTSGICFVFTAFCLGLKMERLFQNPVRIFMNSGCWIF